MTQGFYLPSSDNPQVSFRTLVSGDRMRILVVEDEQTMGDLLRQGLTEEGHSVALARTGPDGLQMAQACEFDVLLLDVMLPGLDGFSLAQKLREAHNRTPVLFLTARDSISDRVRGLDMGGDDYLTKPFSFEELLARIRALVRRGPVSLGVVLSVADLAMDTAAHQVTRSGRLIPLTPKEYSLLELLLRRAGQVVPREVIITSVWGFDTGIEANTLDVFVRTLRQKVDAGFAGRLIHTVRGVGYMLRAEEEP